MDTHPHTHAKHAHTTYARAVPVIEADSSSPSADVDWELLLLLARTEAALTWPAEVSPDGPDLSLPTGLDLHHGCDVDWVSRLSRERSNGQR